MALSTWKFDTVHSSIGFSVRHMVIAKVRGRFAKWEGTAEIDAEDPSKSKVSLQIDAASIDTGDAQRDGHLKSPDFLEVDKHPHITFQSTAVERAGEDTYRIVGDLTIRGATRQVTVDVTSEGTIKDPWGNDRRGFSATATVNRKDFGVVYNQVLEAGGLALGDAVAVHVDAEATKTA
jgi:polyisoprenoid-binding protein YceI